MKKLLIGSVTGLALAFGAFGGVADAYSVKIFDQAKCEAMKAAQEAHPHHPASVSDWNGSFCVLSY